MTASSPPSDDGGRGPGHVVLVGMMGTGKTTVGRLVARRLGRRFVDSDVWVQERTGRTVAEIWRAEGEAAFRRLEAEALADALASPAPAVVAAAGGVVKDPANRSLLAAAGTVVWLRASPATLAGRVRGSRHRPLLDAGDPRDVLARLAAEREPLYAEVADAVIDVEGRSPEQLADEVAALAGEAP